MNAKQGENFQLESVITIRTNFWNASLNYPKHVANGFKPIHG
jgi:hypothetical protein